MAKGLRSKVKRHFRSVKRDTVSQAATHVEAEQSKQEALQKIIEAPKPEHPAIAAADEEMKDAAEDAQLPPLTTKNPAKLARKLKARRLAAHKGMKPGVKKKSNPLAGPNQFHKKKKKR